MARNPYFRPRLRPALLIALIATLLPLTPCLSQPTWAAPSEPGRIPGPAVRVDRTYQVTVKVGLGTETGVAQGGTITLPVRVAVSGAVGLASATVLVQYDPADLRATGCARYADAPNGYCNAFYDTAAGLVRFNIVSDSGVFGDVDLFELTFETAGSSTVNRLSQVTPLIQSLADTQGEYMTSATQGTPVRVLAPSGDGPTVRVGQEGGPNPISITRGTTVTVPIAVSGVTGLGSASFSVPFTPSVVRAVACHAIRPAGSDVSGFCAVHDDRVEASLLSLDGLTGAATLFEVEFTTAASARPGLSSSLNLRVETFADPAGARIPVRVVNNSLRVSSAGTAPAAMLRLQPQTQTLIGDDRVALHLFLDNGLNLAAGSWNLTYDRNFLLAEACQFSPDLPNAACNILGAEGLVRMSVLNVDPAGMPPELASITFRRYPTAMSGMQTTVGIDVTNFANLAGEPLAYQTQRATIQISGNLGEPAAVTLRWGSQDTYGLAVGSSLELPINVTVDAAQPVASLTASLYYDPVVLRPTRCVGTSDQQVEYNGYCNVHYDRTKGSVRFNLLSQAGLTGALAPFLLTFEPVSGAAVGMNSLLAFRIDAVAGPQGEPRTWSVVQPGITILPAVPAAQVKIGDPGGGGPEDDGQYVLEPGGKVTVPVSIVEVTDLGAATLLVKYDPSVVRATHCVVRSDLAGAGGGFCAIVPSTTAPATVRAAFIMPDGFDGSSRFFEMTFAAAPNSDTGKQTSLTVVVDNFVTTEGIPIPTTVGNGSIQIPCKLPAPVLSIALQSGDDVTLSWPHITADVCGLPVTVTSYQLWRDAAPYDLTATEPFATVSAPEGASEATLISTIDSTTRGAPGGFFYRVIAVAAQRANSDFSNMKAKFTYPLVPGTP